MNTNLKILFVIFLIILLPNIAFSFSGKGSGTKEDPYQITNVHELQEVNDQQVESYWILMNDIDASETRKWNLAWPDGDTTKPLVPMGFRPIFLGPFGAFDGKGHIIKNLYENMVDYGGLFYEIPNFTIKNVGIVDCDITGYYVGGFCYRIGGGAISNSFITGKVSGEVAGGICAWGDIAVFNQCYSECEVTGSSESSSFTGLSVMCDTILCMINECYSTGKASGAYVHNVFGDYDIGPDNPIKNCIWNTETSGAKRGGGNSLGRTTVEMMQDSTYHGFDKSVWCFNNGKDYPKLKIFNNCITDIDTKHINSES